MPALLVWLVQAGVRVSKCGSVALLSAIIFSLAVVAQERQAASPAPTPLIRQAVDETQLTRLTGNTHPLARPQFDLGTAPATLPMQRMLLVLKRSPEQEAALDKLMDDQQDKNSPNYHKWLTPEEFGQKFGPTDSDMQTITSWLQSHGFQVLSTRGRTALEFSGSASQVQEAFHTAIHKYVVNGEQHWANATDPSIPTALTPAVAGIASLNDFPRKAMNIPVGVVKRDMDTGTMHPAKPLFTYLPNDQCSADNYCFDVAPYDFATIYDVLPLWNSGIKGTGQTIAIVGDSNINPQDVASFRSIFGLPANAPNIILNGPDPGILASEDEPEADIDVQWSGAVAPNATIDFVVSQSTETTAGIDLSAVYIIENNLAGVMSESFGFCELGLGTAGNQFYSTLWQQAAAQGITVFVAAGDNGSAGCDDFNAQSPAPAQYGLQVSGFASTPYNVAVGGTDFNEFTNPTAYWSTTNNSTTQASALGYIPEIPWNSTCTSQAFGPPNFSSSPETNCNDSRLIPYVDVPVGGSGGVSNCTTPGSMIPSTCAGGYAKPSWQSGKGVPADGKRDVPDVSLFASSGWAGSAYVICESDQTNGQCSATYPYFLSFGGTSVSSPAFAGIMALVNQQYGRQGNANYILYKLAAQQPTAFHDITSGSNAMPCATGSPNCSTTVAGHAFGVLTGYNAASGYDLATGLGSVDANVLVTKWNSVTLAPSTTTLNSLTPATITHGQAANFNVTVASKSGTGPTPTGQISLIAQPTSSITQGIGGFSLDGSGVASGSTEMLPGGTYSLTAHYPGDSAYGPSDSTGISITVNKEASQPKPYLVTFNSDGTISNPNTSTAMYGSSYWLRVDVDNAAGQLCSPVAAAGTASTACPTGTLTLTNNGSPLNAGTYPLNSYGYVEDEVVQLPGGTDSIVASYPGDVSFSASSATAPITITQASTTMSNPTVQTPAVVGVSENLSVIVNTTTSAAAPSGTVTFFANGKALTGTTTYSPTPGGPGYAASLYANLITGTSAFPAPGTYTITATYNGDANYSSSTSAPTTVSVTYPAPVVSVSPSPQTLSYGQTATITALVDTTNKSTYPTGTVTFGSPTLAGPIACSNATDSSGNFACLAVGSFTVTAGGSVLVSYSGDANYPSSIAYAYINMPDFGMSLPGVQVPAGQSQTVTLTISSADGYSGTVTNFACSGLPAETTCTFSPTQVTLPSNGSVSATLTLATTAIGHLQKNPSNRLRAGSWKLSQAVFLFGACIIAIPLSRRRRRVSMVMMLITLVMCVPSCGGSGGGGGGTPNPVPSISSLNPSQIAAGSQVQSLLINGSNFLTSSTVTYNGVSHPASLMSPTQLQIAFSPADIANAGQYPVVVTNPSPGGGPSTAVNFSVLTGTPTGVFNANVSASSGAIVHTVPFTIYVQ